MPLKQTHVLICSHVPPPLGSIFSEVLSLVRIVPDEINDRELKLQKRGMGM